MITLIIFFIYIFCLNRSIEDTVLFYAPFFLLFPTGVTLVGGISLNFCIGVFTFVYFFSKTANKWSKSPISIGCIIMSLSLVVTAVYPKLAPSLLSPIGSMAYCIVLYYILNNGENYSKLVKYSVLFVFIITINGLIEFTTSQNINILGDFNRSIIHEGRFFVENGVERNGMHRTNSCFAHCIAFGVVCAMFFYLVFIFKYVKLISNKKFYWLIAFLGVSIFISNARTSLLAVVILSLGLIPDLKKNKSIFILVLGLAIVAGGTAYNYIESTLTSMFTDNNDYAGSNLELRQSQLEYSLFLINQNPIFGLSTTFSLDEHESIMKGMESVWFGIIITRGFFGVVTYILMYIFLAIKAITRQNRFYLWMLLVGWLVANSSSNMSGLDDYCLWFMYIALYRLEDCYPELYSQKYISYE